MPRAKPLNSRKNAALSFIVEANDTARVVAGMLRRSNTDSFGKPTPLTKKDVERMLKMIERIHNRWDLVENHIEALSHLVAEDETKEES
jgi:Ni,Fe-hydrogenase maturation factor